MKETLELDPAALTGRGDEWKVQDEAELRVPLRLLHTQVGQRQPRLAHPQPRPRPHLCGSCGRFLIVRLLTAL